MSEQSVYQFGDVVFRFDEANLRSCVFCAAGGFVAYLNRDAAVDLQMSLYMLWHERPHIDEVSLWSRSCRQAPPESGALVELCHFYLRWPSAQERRAKKGPRPSVRRSALSYQPAGSHLNVYLTPDEARTAYEAVRALLESRGRRDGVPLVDGFTVHLTGG